MVCVRSSSWPPPVRGSLVTCLEDQQVQRVVPQVGGGGDLMRGDPHQQLLVIPPGEQQTAGRQAQDAVLIDAGLQRQHLQLLLTNTGISANHELAICL